MRKFLTTSMLLLTSICFSSNETQEERDKELLIAIFENENSCVDHYEHQKIYLLREKIHLSENDLYLDLNDDEFVSIPYVISDHQGYYIKCFDVDPLNTCPGCGRRYVVGGCRNANCDETKRRKASRENYEREKREIQKSSLVKAFKN